MRSILAAAVQALMAHKATSAHSSIDSTTAYSTSGEHVTATGTNVKTTSNARYKAATVAAARRVGFGGTSFDKARAWLKRRERLVHYVQVDMQLDDMAPLSEQDIKASYQAVDERYQEFGYRHDQYQWGPRRHRPNGRMLRRVMGKRQGKRITGAQRLTAAIRKARNVRSRSRQARRK